MRWVNKLAALYIRHQDLVKEMKIRLYEHRSSLDRRLAKGCKKQDVFLNSFSEQQKILKRKKCGCNV